MKVLVTGANGFIGRALCAALDGKYEVRAMVRSAYTSGSSNVKDVIRADLSLGGDWSNALDGIDVVIHCAARVHVLQDKSSSRIDEFRKSNVFATLALASQAAKKGIKRFVFLSSIGVNGCQTFGRPFTPDDPGEPHSPYALSKYEAELELRKLSVETGMEVVIIRPPLVYGPEVKANFLEMMRWIWRGIPLPLGGVTENLRSLVYIDNVVDLIVTCIDHPAAANQVFLVSDGQDISTVQLLHDLAVALGRPLRLIKISPDFLIRGARLIGLSGMAQRLCGSLQVDISKTKALLGWTPVMNTKAGLRITGECWRNEKEKI